MFHTDPGEDLEQYNHLQLLQDRTVLLLSAYFLESILESLLKDPKSSYFIYKVIKHNLKSLNSGLASSYLKEQQMVLVHCDAWWNPGSYLVSHNSSLASLVTGNWDGVPFLVCLFYLKVNFFFLQLFPLPCAGDYESEFGKHVKTQLLQHLMCHLQRWQP